MPIATGSTWGLDDTRTKPLSVSGQVAHPLELFSANHARILAWCTCESHASATSALTSSNATRACQSSSRARLTIPGVMGGVPAGTWITGRPPSTSTRAGVRPCRARAEMTEPSERRSQAASSRAAATTSSSMSSVVRMGLMLAHHRINTSGLPCYRSQATSGSTSLRLRRRHCGRTGGRWLFLATLMPNRVVLWLATMRASSAQARARPLPSWGCSSSPYRSSTRTTRTPQLGSCELCWPGARLSSW
jgi:hypothetical protein